MTTTASASCTLPAASRHYTNPSVSLLLACVAQFMVVLDGTIVSAALPSMRRDAQRNLERILSAAHELFSERGIDVPKVEFARRAGVGQGTLYRRCRHRRDLLATLIERRIREVTGWADAFCRDEDAGRARVETMARIIAARQTDRLLREAIEQPGVRNERLVALRGALLEPVGYLPGPARAAGQIRRDLAPQDIPHPIAAAAEPAPCAGDGRLELWRRYLAISAAGPVVSADQPLGPIAGAAQVDSSALPRAFIEMASRS